jgi:hypothetical protein
MNSNGWIAKKRTMNSKAHLLYGLLPVLFVFGTAVFAEDQVPPRAAPSDRKAGDWWSLRTLGRPELPRLGGADRSWARTPIDLFVLAKMREKGLVPSPEADRRTLIRRLHFDLLGLPPSPDEVEAFVADVDPQAYEKLVDRLLASPHYGERWARHWLDVVHYGDTHGYDKDKPRPNAWPYRDYVIRAFDSDRPYGRFVQEQLAGDVLFPDTVDGIEALGFLAAGPWDFIGHAEVPESKTDGKIARHLDRDDMVANTMNTFASTTVQCAQCHDHKFDPIAQEDYYSLHAVFSALDRADRRYYSDPSIARRAADLESRKHELAARKKQLEAEVARAGGTELADLERRIAVLQQSNGEERPEFGYHSQIEAAQDRVKWVQVDLGQSIKIEDIVHVGCHDTFNSIGAGFGFPVRYKIEISDDPAFARDAILVADHTASDVPNPGVVPQTVRVGGKPARYVRVTATRLAPRQSDYIFALAELMVHDASGRNVALGATVTALDSIEASPRWQKKNLVDGYYYGKKSGNDARDLAILQTQRLGIIERKVSEATRKELAETASSLAEAEREAAKLPPAAIVYAGTVHYGSGAFMGTGPSGGKPRPIHVLKRGDVTQPGKEVGPGALGAITQVPGRFDVPPDHPEGERRAALSRWLTDPRNPLTWRSIVNRIWRYHFGRGIVETPNDFGRMGQEPTHPELLDWLAVDFRDNGQSIKRLHRLIVNSAVYRQASGSNEANAKIDADNACLWRMQRRRLEAEAIRDSVLSVAGRLDQRMYGPAFQDFVIDKPEHSPHYEYHLYDPDDPRAHRRSIYRFLVRSQQQPFMTTLDCADPSMQVDRRNETISPVQALALLNDGLMLVMARHFAERIEPLAKDIEGQVKAAFRLALARDPTGTELQELSAYARQHGLKNACRVLLNMNEFVFVD